MLRINKFQLSFLVIVLLIIGFFRYFVFENINVLLFNSLHHRQYQVPSFFNFMRDWSYSRLYFFKWILTLSFCTVFFFNQWLILKTIFTKKNTRIWLIYFYLILLLLSIVSFGIGYLINNPQGGYLFSRKFMGILQSPVPLMLLIPVGILKLKLENYDKERHRYL